MAPSDTSERYSVGISPAREAIEENAITVTSSATELAPSGTPLARRRGLLIYNNGTATIYVGNSGVTTSSGMPVAIGAALFLDVGDSVDVYAIAASGSHNVRIIELA